MAPNMDPNADVINSTATPEEQSAKTLQYLASIESILKNIASGNRSQSAARDMNNNTTGQGQTRQGTFSQRYDDFWRDAKTKKSGSGSSGSIMDQLLDGISDGLMEGLLGSDYKKRIGKAMKEFSDQIGIDLKDIRGSVGKQLGKQAMTWFKGTEFGSKAIGAASKVGTKAVGGIMKAGSAAGPYGILIAAAACVVFAKTLKALGPAIEGTKKLFNALNKAGDRYNQSRMENIKLEKKRLEEDVRALVEEPFNI